jgi:hypothetical protein
MLKERKMKAYSIALAVIIILASATACRPAATPPPELPTSTAVPPTSTPIPSTATLTPVPPTPRPTSTPTEAFTLASSTDEIVGTWSNPQIVTHRFNKDGTVQHSYSPDTIDKPFAIDEFWFEGTKLYLKTTFVSGVPKCAPTGIYEVRLLESGNIQIKVIEDKCSPRIGDTEGIFKAVR